MKKSERSERSKKIVNIIINLKNKYENKKNNYKV